MNEDGSKGMEGEKEEDGWMDEKKGTKIESVPKEG